MHEFHWDNAKILLPKSPDMKYLYIEITNRCNLRCEMCFKQYWEDKEGDMDYDLFLKILRDAEEFPNLKMIYFGGIGEPLVHPRFMDMVKEVKKRGYALGISTNGFPLTDKLIEELVKLRVDLIYISLDAIPTQPTKLGHIMPSVTVERLKKFAEIKKRENTEIPHVGVEVVLTKENYTQMAELVKYLSKFNIDALLFSNLMPITAEHAEMIIYDGSVDISNALSKLYPQIYRGFPVKVAEFKLRSERHCDFVENNVAVVRWDGEVAPCYRFLHTYPEHIFGREKRVEAYSFGNVKEKSLKEIWTGREYTWFRFSVRNSLYPSCTDCPIVDACDYAKGSKMDCWGNVPSCGDCLWARRIVLCPIPREEHGKFW